MAAERRAAAEALRRVRESFTPKAKAPAKDAPPTEGDGVRTVTRDRKAAPGETPTDAQKHDADTSPKASPPSDPTIAEKKPAIEPAPVQPTAQPGESPEDDDINPDR